MQFIKKIICDNIYKYRKNNRKYINIFGVKFKYGKVSEIEILKKELNNAICCIKNQTERSISNRMQDIIDLTNNIRKDIKSSSVFREKELQIYMSAAQQHNKVFPKYRDINLGKEMVILASGPTLDYYTAQEGKLFLGVNKSFLAGKADLDYLFVQDYFQDVQNLIDEYKGNNCQKFYGIHYCAQPISEIYAQAANAQRYYFIDCNWNAAWSFPPDISVLPFNTYSSVIHPAVTFALWTGVSKIYLVGCDTNNSGYSQKLPNANERNNLYTDNVLKGWHKMKEYASTFYPKTEIISINPVGLKGLFKDVYTQNYIDEHPSILQEMNDNIEILESKRSCANV